MPTRASTTWKPRADGQFDSRVGWKPSIGFASAAS